MAHLTRHQNVTFPMASLTQIRGHTIAGTVIVQTLRPRPAHSPFLTKGLIQTETQVALLTQGKGTSLSMAPLTQIVGTRVAL